MKTLTATEAKSQFAALLGDVERGETILITRHGKTVARIVPNEMETSAQMRAGNAVRKLRSLRESLPRTGTSLEDMLSWKHEDHRY
ncbi:type II toxin-antitoxin system Phd/YefM family antitoxin [uncultured Nitratireductor sp.]|uniref:type II toxin-antitoxin system Phd/YefM family antitoxin n=1 Tax=uncultured Nitratireductor sp. TaxID=520953 RepID=UPI0025D05B0C|nr:type II toxin-antitoxin system prevent-host-death family antitoxin [uncultured Nitratireductor sp.]